MGLLEQGTQIISRGGRAITVGLGAAFNELRGGSEQEQQASQQQEQGSGGQQPQQRQASRKPKDLDDVTIARKVESEIFRGQGRRKLKAQIDVNAVDGNVYLRGVAPTPELIKQLEAEAGAIAEVKGVENLLHLPHTPAPTRADTPRNQQKTRRSPRTGPRREPRQLNADKTVQQNDDLPETLAKEGKGRRAAPLGSEGEGSDDSSASAPEDFSSRPRKAGEDPVGGERAGTEQPARTRVGTDGGPSGGSGEVVH